MSGTDPCDPDDGIASYGGWTAASGKADQITAAANNPLGTGRGFRHYREAGTNSNGGGLSITFPNTRKLWVRVYMRYSAGFRWANGDPHYAKDLFFRNRNGVILGFGGGRLQTYVNPGTQSIGSSDTWSAINGGDLGDGKFHCYEWHIDMGSTRSRGALKIWRDGRLVLDRNRVTISPDLDEVMNNFVLGSNQNFVVGNHYTDYDDLVISTTGYIGPALVPPDQAAR